MLETLLQSVHNDRHHLEADVLQGMVECHRHCK
jgi:hypothetical protein